MKTFTTFALIGALALSTAAFADASPSSSSPGAPSASKQCRTERSAMGIEVFRQTYGTNHNKRNAFGKCVSSKSQTYVDPL